MASLTRHKENASVASHQVGNFLPDVELQSPLLVEAPKAPDGGERWIRSGGLLVFENGHGWRF
jgi:hypothetical protein